MRWQSKPEIHQEFSARLIAYLVPSRRKILLWGILMIPHVVVVSRLHILLPTRALVEIRYLIFGFSSTLLPLGQEPYSRDVVKVFGPEGIGILPLLVAVSLVQYILSCVFLNIFDTIRCSRNKASWQKKSFSR